MKKFSVTMVFVLILFLTTALVIQENEREQLSTNSQQEYIDGVQIDNHEWMTQNLRVKEFRNGDPIKQVGSKDEWRKALENKEPAWCYLDFDPEKGEKYGKLYNQYAVLDPRGLAPEGWRLPTREDWKDLASFLEDKFDGRTGNLRNNTGLWKQSEIEPSFSAVPGGNYSNSWGFANEGSRIFWWAKTENDDGSPFLSHTELHRNGSLKVINHDNNDGLYVRCIKD